MGLLLHSLWVKDRVKTNELPMRESLCESSAYFCFNSLFLLFTQSPFLFFFSVSPHTVCPTAAAVDFSVGTTGSNTQSLYLTHTHTNTHTDKKAARSWEQRGVTGQKVACVCVLIWITTRRRITTFLCILMLFSCRFVRLYLFCRCIQCEAFRKPFVSL